MNRERTPHNSHARALGPEQSGPSFDEERLEMAIESTRQALLGARTREIRLELQETMRQLISQRSPWMIARLEREKGLR